MFYYKYISILLTHRSAAIQAIHDSKTNLRRSMLITRLLLLYAVRGMRCHPIG